MNLLPQTTEQERRRKVFGIIAAKEGKKKTGRGKDGEREGGREGD